MNVNIIGITHGLLSFATIELPVIVMDIDLLSTPSITTPIVLCFDDVAATGTTFNKYVADYINNLEDELSIGVCLRVNLSGQQGLYPENTVTFNDEKIIINNWNSSSVVAVSYKLTDLNNYSYNLWADCRGYGSYVYSPIILIRANNDNNRFCLFESLSITQNNIVRFSTTENLQLDLTTIVPIVNVNLLLTPASSTATITTLYIHSFNTLNFNGYIPPPTPGDDPYAPGDESDTGGGEGDFDNTSDVIDIPAYPTSTVDNTGFISLYNPDMVQLRSLASYMWGSQGLDLDTFKRIFSDPISTILGLTIMPVAPVQGSTRTVVLGNVSTGVQMPRVDQQFTRFDCGTLNVNEYWGGYLDYSPYTQAEIYLPFIGVKKLDADDIMGKAVNVSYMFDFLSGACCAYIKVNGSVLYQFAGQCAASIPVTGNDMTSMINGVMSMVSSGISGFMAGGATGAAVGAVGSLASNVSNMKPHAEKSGSMGGMAGLLGVRSPYIILTRPRQALPANQNTFTGYPSYITEVLGNLTGFTQVQDVHLTNIGAMDAEIDEIEGLLKEGVYL